ncbi:hypothetical protein HK100_011624 [Physocladia obscura]|uniref:Protein Asterix n=1 Tax=Physocladia obscura TaxID=109957 RepID=A0AAD5T2F7_9FUNG|nr:hypothetical protein HK100_011624 [Physocladia obscura]
MGRRDRNNDPRRPDAIVPYSQPPVSADAADPDFFGIISLLGAFIGLVTRQKFAVWLSLVAAIISQLTSKISEKEYRQGSGTLAFTLMGILMLYMQQLLTLTNEAVVAEKESLDRLAASSAGY